LIPVTHQEGHLRAGLETSEAGAVLGAGLRLLAVHLSGGTSELLILEPAQAVRARGRSGRPRPLFDVILTGGTIDLHAGQFLDHLGVHMGLPFPAGSHLERLAKEGRPDAVTLPVAAGLRDGRFYFSLSGPLSAAYRALGGGAAAADVAWAAQRALAKALEKMIRPAVESTGIKDVLVVGGVASNAYLRERLGERLGHRAVGARLYFPDGRLCTDNAVGVAWQGAALWPRHRRSRTQ
jgi:N6-L-threonylcarbamoyladenine synthase